jgi:hypothetical protein
MQVKYITTSPTQCPVGSLWMMPFHAHISQGDPLKKSALKRIIKPHKKDIAQRAGIDDAGGSAGWPSCVPE